MFCDIGTKTNLFTDMHNSKFIYTFALKIINLIMAGIYLHIPCLLYTSDAADEL